MLIVLYLYSGGVMVVFRGSDLDVVQTVLIIDIVDGATISNNAEVDMSYNTVSFYMFT